MQHFIRTQGLTGWQGSSITECGDEPYAVSVRPARRRTQHFSLVYTVLLSRVALFKTHPCKLH